ncbi:MAG: 2-hydroxyacyl-CoA dehydratase family protein [Smithellaceae bacterium]|nr:2-hydroxyacyl-CoA dehydratase family protein [Smithellaceae bacterium]
MDSMRIFREVAANPLAYGEQYHRTKDRRLMGYLCSYAPEELILAAGLHPYRLFGARGNIHRADAHLQSYCCSLVRGVLENALAGRLDFLAGVVFPHTCDSIQRLSDIWRLRRITPFHADLVLPVKLNTESAGIYLREVLIRLKREIEEWQGITITEADLREAISIMNRIRQGLKDIFALRTASPEVLSGADLNCLTRTSFLMDRFDLADKLALLRDDLMEKGFGTTGKGRKRLLLAGGFCDLPEIYGIIEEAGADVVGDDLCTGARAFSGLIDESREPLLAIAERYLTRAACAAKHQGLTSRGEHLLRLVREKEADGVVFTWLKFCDPQAFDYPYLKAFLDQAGIPSLVLELEDQLPGEGQLQTRFEAFIETI